MLPVAPTELPSPPRRNCLVWAWQMQRAHGGRVRISRHSTMSYKIRALWSPAATGDDTWFAYLSPSPKRGLAAVFHAIWFRGRVVRHKAPTGRGWIELHRRIR